MCQPQVIASVEVYTEFVSHGNPTAFCGRSLKNAGALIQLVTLAPAVHAVLVVLSELPLAFCTASIGHSGGQLEGTMKGQKKVLVH